MPIRAGRSIVNGPVLLVSNEVAGNGRARKRADEIQGVFIDRFGKQKRALPDNIYMGHSVECLATARDPEQRVAEIGDAIVRLGGQAPGTRVHAISIGGDRTTCDVFDAVNRASRLHQSFSVVAAAYKAGIANDISQFLGTPTNPSDLPLFLSLAPDIPLYGFSVLYDGNRTERSYHAASFGVSGAIWGEVENARKRVHNALVQPDNGHAAKVSIIDYVRSLTQKILTAPSFYVRVNGSIPVRVGEVIVASDIASLGGVTRLSLSEQGVRSFLVNPPPYGVLQVAEVLFKGGLAHAGFQRINMPGRPFMIPYARQIDLAPGERATLEFVNKDGGPVKIEGTLNGDYQPSTHRVTIEADKQTTPVLVGRSSDMSARLGLAKPRWPLVGPYPEAVMHGIALRLSRTRGECQSMICNEDPLVESLRKTTFGRLVLNTTVLPLASYVIAYDAIYRAVYGKPFQWYPTDTA